MGRAATSRQILSWDHHHRCKPGVCITQVPKVLELVGLGYTAWFVYRYLLFKVRVLRMLVVAWIINTFAQIAAFFKMKVSDPCHMVQVGIMHGTVPICLSHGSGWRSI